MPELKSENNLLFGIAALLVILGSFAILGFTGMRTILGMIAVMFLPVYLIFNNFSLNEGEKVIFSFFISIMAFPSLTYWLGFIIPFRFSIAAVFVLLLLTSFLLKYHFKKLKLF